MNTVLFVLNYNNVIISEHGKDDNFFEGKRNFDSFSHSCALKPELF